MRESCTCKFLELDFLKSLNYSSGEKIKRWSPIDIVAVPHIIYIYIIIYDVGEVCHTCVHARALSRHFTTSSANIGIL